MKNLFKYLRELVSPRYKLVKTIKYIHNNGYFFSSGDDTWHGLELKEIKKENRGTH